MSRKPKILYLADVDNWAWAIKGRELKRHLSDEFDFTIVYHIQNRSGFNVNDHDIYFSLSWSQIEILHQVPFDRRVSGVTAHKSKEYFTKTIIPSMSKVKWIHANSKLLVNELNEAGIHHVFYVPNGVNEELFHVKVPIAETRDNLIVGHVGKKCGSGTDAKGHKRFIEPACAKAGVVYRGHYSNYRNATPHEKMVDIYQEIDCFLVSSETDGTPNGALEAAACGRPIISNKIGNMPEFIVDGYNGFLVPRNVEAYVEKLLYLKHNRAHLAEMGKHARKTIEDGWTWKIQAENYRKMFKSIINSIGLR